MPINKTQKANLNKLIHEILELRDKVCLRCGKPDFQVSHIYPKGRYKKLEFDSQNILALCYACHLHWWHKNPIEAEEWVKKFPWYEQLKIRSQTCGDGCRNYKTLKVFLEEELKQLQKYENQR